jgi:long-subunit fatty acid transport protein
MKRPGASRVVLSLALAMACAGSPLRAQTNLETNAGVYFNFATPGAGNLALGGAFLALAFDASAAYTNPAGLTAIAEPEALVEARHWSYTHVFTDRGRIEGQAPTEQGEDDVAGLRDGEAQNQVTGLSFLSYVYPHHAWSFALFRHELVNFEADFSTFGAYLERTRGRSPRGIPGELDGRLAALRNRMAVDVVAYGSAAAYRVGHGISLGVAVSYFDFSIDSTADRFLPQLLEEPDFSSDPLVNFQTQQGEDTDWGIAAGFLWESGRRRWSVGGVYRQGPDFTFRARSAPGPGTSLPFDPSDNPAFFHVPDVYGLGLAFRPSDSLLLAVDYDRVLYSQLTQGFVDIFNLAELAPGQSPELDRFRIDDADEIHLGLEYAFLQRWPVLTLRAGAWHETDHSLRFDGDNVGFRAVFRRRGDQTHVTGGVGLSLRRLQIDAAVDHSSRVSVVALSAGTRF